MQVLAPRHRRTKLVHRLLAFAAAPTAVDGSVARAAVSLEAVDDCQFQWVLDAGLGPLLQRAMQHDTGAIPDKWRDTLVSAELTAQVRHAELVETAIETIDACEAAGTHATLLKGISISDQYYPAAHLRPMNDIDILIPSSAYGAVESMLLQRGFSSSAFPRVDGLHHGAPLQHPRDRKSVV